MNKLILVLGICILLIGCDEFEWVQKRNIAPIKQITAPVEQTLQNTTNETTYQKRINVQGNRSYFAFSKGSTVFLSKNSSIVIDAGDLSPNKILGRNRRSAEALIITTNSKEKAGSAKYFILAEKPKRVYDNGINTETRKDYMRYANRLNVTGYTVSKKRIELMGDVIVEFFVPFEHRGFFSKDEMNSLVIGIGDLIYMSNCYGRCESDIKLIRDDYKFLVLANLGACPTTSLDFILNSGADKIYGKELCPGLLSTAGLTNIGELELLGIEFIKLDDGIIYEEAT